MRKIMVCFFLLTFSTIILIGCSENSKDSMTGIYLKSINGHNFIINDGTPITMGNKTDKEDIFDDLRSGDKIEITYDSILETYPAQTQIYSCKLIERGSVDYIPKDVLDRLQEMGYEFNL